MTQQIGRTVMAMAIVATLGLSVAHAQEQRKTTPPPVSSGPSVSPGTPSGPGTTIAPPVANPQAAPGTVPTLWNLLSRIDELNDKLNKETAELKSITALESNLSKLSANLANHTHNVRLGYESINRFPIEVDEQVLHHHRFLAMVGGAPLGRAILRVLCRSDERLPFDGSRSCLT